MTFATMDVIKKDESGKTMILWDAISPCHPHVCPIKHLCPYESHQAKCEVEAQYISVAVASIITSNNLTEAQVHHAGTVLMPLYSHLVKFKLVELSLETPIVKAKKGHQAIHPIYKEIRETIKTINKVWTDLFKAEVKSKLPKLDDLLEHGDQEYIKNLYKSNEEENKLPRRH